MVLFARKIPFHFDMNTFFELIFIQFVSAIYYM